MNLSLPKVNKTKYGLKSWRYFAAKTWNELTNDIRIKAGTNEVKNKIQRRSGLKRIIVAKRVVYHSLVTFCCC